MAAEMITSRQRKEASIVRVAVVDGAGTGMLIKVMLDRSLLTPSERDRAVHLAMDVGAGVAVAAGAQTGTAVDR